MANLDSMEYASSFPTIFKYLVMIVLYVMVFLQFKKPYIQFILYMVMLILNFFTVVFLATDMFSVPMLMRSIYGQFIPNDASGFNNPFTVFYVLIIILSGLLSLCSLAIILAVFAYGKKTTNDYKSYKMTSTNTLILSIFQVSYIEYMKYLAIFAFFVVFAHTTGPTRQIMFNIACILLSLLVIAASGYGCLAAVTLLKVKQYNKQLYE